MPLAVIKQIFYCQWQTLYEEIYRMKACKIDLQDEFLLRNTIANSVSC